MEPTEMDSLLLPYVQAAGEAEAQQLIAKLMIDEADPIINRIVARKLGFLTSGRLDDGADVRSEIVLQLLRRLNLLRVNPTETPIANFRAYVVVASYRGCAEYLRQKYPQRWRLANRLYYLLKSQPQFDVWQNEHEGWFGGLSDWANDVQTRHWLNPDRVQQLLERPLPTSLQNIPDATFRRVSAATQMQALLNWANEFIGLDDLVTIFAHWWSVKVQVPDQDRAAIHENSPTHLNPEIQMEQRLFLQKLWAEIKVLPLRQRAALLLNLRAGQGQSALTFLPVLQIANVRQIAEVLDMPSENLAEFWNKLPLEDTKIATLLGVTRRQVINLRLTARERLTRKIRLWEKI